MMWRHLFPEGAADPVGYVTNGVHTASWVGPEMRSFYQQHVDPDWEGRLLEPAVWSKVKDAPDAALWAAHRVQKERLVRFVRERVRVQSARHGLSPDAVGRALVQGCDVWLNTPRRPQEASGTSGQKVPINGGVNLSILDGWWAEGYRADAESLYRALETEVVPRFFARESGGLPLEWLKTMKASIESVVAPFSAHRMVRDYVVGSYLSAAEAGKG